MAKQAHTAQQLENMMMIEARKHIECSDLTGIIIVAASGDPNWTVTQLQNSSSSMCATTMEGIVARHQRLFDLAG